MPWRRINAGSASTTRKGCWRAGGLRKWVLVCTAAGHVILASGVVYGWTALRPLLTRAGYLNAGGDEAQAAALSGVATAGIAANALCKLPLGLVMDSFGPRITAVLGCLMMIAGALLIALGPKQSFSAIGGGYFLLGTSGPFIQMPCFPFSNLFPENRSTVLSLLITCFELSTGVFVIFNELYFHAQVHVETLFLGYAALAVAMALSAALLWPDYTEDTLVEYHSEADEEEATAQLYRPQSGTCLEGSTEESNGSDEHRAVHWQNTQQRSDDDDGSSYCEAVPSMWLLPWWRQMATREFTYVSAFLMIHVFRQGFTLTTMLSQLLHFFPDVHLACRLADTFSLFLPLGFLPILLFTSSGANAYLLNRPALSFVVATLISMAWGLLFLTPTVPAYIAIFVIFPVARQFVYSTFFAYSVSVFGYDSFGRISGMACTLAGLTQFAQLPLIRLIKEGDTPLQWWHVDIALGLLPALLLLPILWEWATCCGGSPNALTGEKHEREDSVLLPLASEVDGAQDEVPSLVPMRRNSSTAALAALRAKSRSQPMDVPHFGSFQMCASMADSIAGSIAYSSYTSPNPGDRKSVV